MPYLVATLIYLSQNYSYYIRGDRSPLIQNIAHCYAVIALRIEAPDWASQLSALPHGLSQTMFLETKLVHNLTL